MISARTRAQFFRYALTGAAAAVVDTSVFTVLVGAIGVPVASVCSFCVAAVVNYSLTSFFVFGHAWEVRQLARFVVVASLGMLINVGVTVAASVTIPFRPLLAHLALLAHLPPGSFAPFVETPAKVCGIAAAFLFNFYLNTTIVFRRPPVPVGPAA